jgi:hypothetical protein
MRLLNRVTKIPDVHKFREVAQKFVYMRYFFAWKWAE